MEITPDILRIDDTNGHVYVITAAGTVVQIDSGLRGQFKNIKKFYDLKGIAPDIIIVTHSHMDHIGELARVVAQYGPNVYAHAKEIPVITGKSGMYSRSGLLKVVGSFMKPKPVGEVQDITNLNVSSLSVIETVGHTPGSISVLYERAGGRYLFVGDAAFEKDGRLFVNEKYSLDVETAKKSLEKIYGLKPVLVLPGHGEPVEL